MMTLILKDLSGTRVFEHSLRRWSDLKYTTQYPGGLCGVASFFLSLNPRGRNFIRGGYTLEIYDGLLLVWEGLIDDLEDMLQPGKQGLAVSATGFWGAKMGREVLDRRWWDVRLDQNTWVWNEDSSTATGAEKCTLDRYNRIRFTPKGVAWTSGQYAAVRYTAPVGETAKYLSFSYNLTEGAQAWEISAWRSTDGSAWTQMTNVSGETYTIGTTTVITASGTGSVALTLATPSRYLELRFYARANQTPTEDGTYFGQYTSLGVRSSAAASANLTTIATDLQTLFTNSTDTTYIASNTFDLEGFVTSQPESLASILNRAASFGDSSQNPWAGGTVLSSRTRDGLSALFTEQQPTKTSYDYSLSAREAQLHAVRRNIGDIWNYISVEYTNYLGVKTIITPVDDSSLSDATSIAQYGQREKRLDLGVCSEDLAYNYGKRFLAKYKQPNYSVSVPLRVRQVYGSKGKGLVIPASQIKAGKLLLLTDYLTDLSGTGLILLITQTEYDHNSRMCTLSFGVPDNLSVLLAQRG